MHNKKYLFYPFSNKSFGFVKGLLTKKFDFEAISPKGLGLQNKDIAFSVNKKNLGKKVRLLKDVQIKHYDSLIISSFLDEDILKDELTNFIEQATDNDLEIILLGRDEVNIQKLSNYKYLIRYGYYEEEIIEKHISKFKELNLPFYSSNRPVVFIGGIFEYIDNFNIALQLKIKLDSEGYNSVLVSNEKDASYFGALRYPKEFMNSKIDPIEQIIILDRFIRAIEYTYSPNLILLHQPKGMLMYNQYHNNTFGIYTYLLSQSVRPDYLIVNVPISLTNLEYLDALSNHFKNILGQHVDVFNIVNEEYEIGNQTVATLGFPTFVHEEKINELLESYFQKELNLYNLNEYREVEKVVNKIINDLSGSD